MVTVYTCLKIYLYKKALFIFVNNIIFFSMLYHGAVEYVANTWICVYMIVKFSYFQVEIVGPIFRSFLKKKKKKKK